MKNLFSKTNEVIKSSVTLTLLLGIAIGGVVVGGSMLVRAESFPGGTDNGKTSHIKQLNDDLATLGYGSPSNTPDWGANWNRINTASKWLPNGNISPIDVVNGKKFYNASRIEQTGTKLVVGPCPTQIYQDQSGSKADGCVADRDWVVASPSVAGDDKQDKVTGLVWSKCLLNTGVTTDFSPSASCTTYSWGNTHANNSSRTAIQLCSDRGNGWRLPGQKELMQAYIDGSNFNLVTTAANHWSATEGSGTYAWNVTLSTGYTTTNPNGNAYQVRCVR